MACNYSWSHRVRQWPVAHLRDWRCCMGQLQALRHRTTVSSDATRAAWTVGGGVEWLFAPRWSTKLEYLYVDTDSVSVTLFGVPFTGRARDHIVRAGVNYHF
jgi:opacity protein-like surface antigen